MVVVHKLAAAVAVDWILASMVVEQIGTMVVEREKFAVESFANHMFG